MHLKTWAFSKLEARHGYFARSIVYESFHVRMEKSAASTFSSASSSWDVTAVAQLLVNATSVALSTSHDGALMPAVDAVIKSIERIAVFRICHFPRVYLTVEGASIELRCVPSKAELSVLCSIVSHCPRLWRVSGLRVPAAKCSWTMSTM